MLCITSPATGSANEKALFAETLNEIGLTNISMFALQCCRKFEISGKTISSNLNPLMHNVPKWSGTL